MFLEVRTLTVKDGTYKYGRGNMDSRLMIYNIWICKCMSMCTYVYHVLVCVHVPLCPCVYAYISWLCPLKRLRSGDIPAAMGTANAQILISNTIPYQKEPVVLWQMAESRTAEEWAWNYKMNLEHFVTSADKAVLQRIMEIGLRHSEPAWWDSSQIWNNLSSKLNEDNNYRPFGN